MAQAWTPTDIVIAAIAALPEVERVSPWKDRHYINLVASRGSHANADLRSKLWVKGNVLVYEAGKGYHSDAYLAAKRAVIAAAAAAGATVQEG